MYLIANVLIITLILFPLHVFGYFTSRYTTKISTGAAITQHEFKNVLSHIYAPRTTSFSSLFSSPSSASSTSSPPSNSAQFPSDLRAVKKISHSIRPPKSKSKIRVDELLVANGIATDLKHAQALILSGQVISSLHGTYVTQPSLLVSVENKYRLKVQKKTLDELRYVSRGGLKLEEAVRKYNLAEKIIGGSVCIDLGASTGGFTDCLLQNNASLVYSVDVGVSLLDWKIRSDPRVKVLEKINARYLNHTHIDPSHVNNIDVVVCDVSFISLRSVLPAAISLCNPNKSLLVALIKPQFECQKEHVSQGGIVRDDDARQHIVAEIRQWFTDNYCISENNAWNLLDTIESPLTGQDGNKEYLLVATRGK